MTVEFLDPDAWRAMFSALPWTWPTIAGMAGANFASFAGVVAHRLPHSSGMTRDDAESGVSLWARSRCDACGAPISALALVPAIGWLVCRGKCPSCGSKVPVAYPVVEMATAVLSAGIAWALGPTESCFWALAAIWALLAASWTDLLTEWLPDRILMPLLLAGLLGSPFEPDALSRNEGMASASVGMWALMALLGRAKGVDAMSGGDIFLAAAAGAWVGIQGIPAFFLITGVAFFVHFTWALRTGAGRARMEGGSRFLPMGPAISVGFVAVVAMGPFAHVVL